MMTCGIWKPITLEIYEARIDDVWVKYQLGEDLKKVEGEFLGSVSGVETHNYNVRFELPFNGASIAKIDGV
jgi:beta-mannosidase